MSNHIRERSQSLKRSNRASQALKPLPFELQFELQRKCNPSQARNSLIQTCPRPNSEADRTLRHICSSCAIRSNSFTETLSRLRDRQEISQKPWINSVQRNSPTLLCKIKISETRNSFGIRQFLHATLPPESSALAMGSKLYQITTFENTWEDSGEFHNIRMATALKCTEYVHFGTRWTT